MAKKAFQKFIQQKETGAKKKERIRQEKKKLRRETDAYFEKKKHGGSREMGVGSRESEVGSRKSEVGSRESGVGKVKGALKENKKGLEKRSVKAVHTEKKPNVQQQGSGSKISSADTMPLNKYIAHAGICSRRDAAELVKSGKVTVNGAKIIEPGFKVSINDDVTANGKKLAVRRNLVYILLNKPKDYITTTDDPEGRKTVLDIVKHATTERVYPIGRLDRNTTGVLLLTNDGELAQKLSHPSYEVKKIYEVTLDKQVSKKDFESIANGITLEDGFIQPDAIAYPDLKNKHIIGIEIHSGRNRIVRRIFEQLGYDVRNLDRVMYAGLTKKNVDRGKWRYLNEKEVRILKFLNASYKKPQPSKL